MRTCSRLTAIFFLLMTTISSFAKDKIMNEEIIINRSIQKEFTVPTNLEEIWAVWTTKKGLETFFAPECKIEKKVLGLFEIYFDPNAEPGKRGAENNRIMAIEAFKMFSFTWDAPGYLPNVRKQRTLVVLKFKQLDKNKTRVFFSQTGWGDGPEWDTAFDYFTEAWDVVFKRLQIRFEKGPIDWSADDYPWLKKK